MLNTYKINLKKENVIQATIHKDESRPHLHVYLVPENKETGKLQARKSLDRNFKEDHRLYRTD